MFFLRKTTALLSLLSLLSTNITSAFAPVDYKIFRKVSQGSQCKSALTLEVATIPLDASSTAPTYSEGNGIDNAAVDDRDAWIRNLDFEAFGKEVDALGKKLQKEAGDDDVEHLNKILEWRDWACLLGVASMWAAPNPLTILALSTWTYSSWTMVAHHTCHGGYNRVDAGKYNSRGFALGTITRRISD